jgi:hypothetical protein
MLPRLGLPTIKAFNAILDALDATYRRIEILSPIASDAGKRE